MWKTGAAQGRVKAAMDSQKSDAARQLDLHGAPLELDLLYNEIDKLYHAYARGCGLSDCAYWMLYDLVLAGGELPLARLTMSWSYSKQTINSALKSLQTQGYVELSFVEGSRKNKLARLTRAGRELAEERIIPAILAERRAFETLDPEEQRTLIHLVRRYASALDEQISSCSPNDPNT